MNTFQKDLEESLSEIFTNAVQLLPKIVLGILGLLIAWLAIKVAIFVLRKILRAAKFDALSNKITKAGFFGGKEVKVDLIKIITAITKILLVLLFVVVLADVLGLNAISEGVVSIFGYLPTLISSLAIFGGGMYLASIVKKTTLTLFDSMGINGSKFISGTLFYLIAFFISITALNQAGIDTQIITSNFTLILGAFLFAAALGFGLGSREVFSNVLKTFYARKTYMVGDVISFDGIEGSIDAIDGISVTLNTENGKMIIPIADLVAERVVLKE